MRIKPQVWFSIAVLFDSAVGLEPNMTYNPGFYFEWEENAFIWGYEIVLPSAAPEQTVDSSIIQYSKIHSGSDSMMFKWDFKNVSSQPGNLTSAILVDHSSANSIVARGYLDDNGEEPPEDGLLYFPLSFSRDTSSVSGSLTLDSHTIPVLHDDHANKILFFQLGWTTSDDINTYGTSAPWAFAENDTAATSLYFDMAAAGTPMIVGTSANAVFPPATTANVDPSATSSGTSASGSLSTPTTTATPPSSGSSAKDSSAHRLSTGEIVGIAIGSSAALVLVVLALACVCLRRRRRRVQAGHSRGIDAADRQPHHLRDRDVHIMQDLMMADKERRAGLAGDDQPLDTPYSEEPEELARSGGPVARELSGLRSGESSELDLRLDDPADEWRQRRRGSGAYSSLRGGTPVVGSVASGSPTSAAHAKPSDSAEQHERASKMTGSPVPRTSSLAASVQPSPQQDRAFKPYRDRGTGAELGGEEVDRDAERSTTASVDEDGNELHRGAHGRASGTTTPQLDGPSTSTSFLRAETPVTAISERYAHLVEEGMTEEELRRLEEEERALDEAIEERARSDSRATER